MSGKLFNEECPELAALDFDTGDLVRVDGGTGKVIILQNGHRS